MTYFIYQDSKWEFTKVCFFVNTYLNRAQWIFKKHFKDLITLNLCYMKNNESKCLHIHNIYHEAIQEDITELFNLLNSLLKKNSERQHLMIKNLNLHHSTWSDLNIKKDKETEQLLIVMNKKQLSFLLFQKFIIWRISKLQNTIDLFLSTSTITQRLMSCKVMKKNYDLNHHLILTSLLLKTSEIILQTK